MMNDVTGLGSGLRANWNSIVQRFVDVDVACIDLFDTLMVRQVARPIDAFCIARELLNTESEFYLTQTFSLVRANAELLLRQEAVGQGLSADTVTLEEIYIRVGLILGIDGPLLEALQAAEMDTERQLLCPVPAAVSLVQARAQGGGTTLVVSDTYLPRPFMEELLHRSLVAHSWELWLSNERQVGKADGSMWAAIRREHPRASILHLGDNEVADVIQPRAFGISAMAITSPSQSMRHEAGVLGSLNGSWRWRHLEVETHQLANSQRSLVAGIAANELAADPSATVSYAFGLGVVGPALVGLVQWIHRTAVDNGYDHLYFLARDGHLIRESYLTYFGQDSLPTTYLAASRRLLNFAAIGDRLTTIDVNFLTQTSWPIPVGTYITRLAVPDIVGPAKEFLTELGISFDDPGTSHGAEIRALFWHLEPQLVRAAQLERLALESYWRQEGFATSLCPAVVDIGWHGSLQFAINRIREDAGLPWVAGLYFGLHSPRPMFGGQTEFAYVDAAIPSDRKMHADLVAGSVSPLEFCFTRPEGTVMGLTRMPDECQAGSGRWVAVHATDRLPTEDAKVVEEVQSGAITFVEAYKRAVAGLPSTIAVLDRSIAVEPLVMALHDPAPQVAHVIGNCHHADGFGEGVRWERIGAPTLDSIIDLSDGADRVASEFSRTSWRAGFMANAKSSRLPIP